MRFQEDQNCCKNGNDANPLNGPYKESMDSDGIVGTSQCCKKHYAFVGQM